MCDPTKGNNCLSASRMNRNEIVPVRLAGGGLAKMDETGGVFVCCFGCVKSESRGDMLVKKIACLTGR